MIYKDGPLPDAGIKKMIVAIVNKAIVDYVNSIIFFKKHPSADPLSARASEYRRSIKDCEEFFLYEYEYMKGEGDGQVLLKNLREIAQARSTYVNRCWAKELLE